MSTSPPWLLCLGIFLGEANAFPALDELARWREMLYDRHSPLQQSQAALLLVTSQIPEAAEIIREGLRQTQSAEVFLALGTAVRTAQDRRFLKELLAALASGRANLRQAAAESLATLATKEVVLKLQAMAADDRLDQVVRQAALWTLGRCGQKQAAPILLDHLSRNNEALRRTAAEALAELTGLSYGLDLTAWHKWWQQHKDGSSEQWLEERLAFQASRSRRLEGELERSRAQAVRLHQQLYSRLPAADRLSYLQSLVEAEDPGARALVVPWCVEMLTSADSTGQKALTEVLLRLSQDDVQEVQRSAILALGRVTDPRVLERLQSLLRTGAGPVRAAAARSLAQMARGTSPEAQALQRQIVPALQQALTDPVLEVVVEAAEDLGSLGLPQAGPVLIQLLKHPSEAVRQAAAQALERVADVKVLDHLLGALKDPAVSVRFSMLGALANAAGEGKALSEAQRQQLFSRLEMCLTRDGDPGVRSRAATVLGDCAGASALPVLWKRVLASEDSRVQDKAWTALVEVLARSANPALFQQWDTTLTEAKQPARRLQLLTELHARWQKKEETHALADAALESLVTAFLDQSKWSSALPHLRDLLNRSSGEAELDRRLRWLLAAGQQALKEGQSAEVLKMVQEAQAPLSRRKQLAGDFEKLEKLARQKP